MFSLLSLLESYLKYEDIIFNVIYYNAVVKKTPIIFNQRYFHYTRVCTLYVSLRGINKVLVLRPSCVNVGLPDRTKQILC